MTSFYDSIGSFFSLFLWKEFIILSMYPDIYRLNQQLFTYNRGSVFAVW